MSAPTFDRITGQSVWPDLEPLLPAVKKPIQYVGGELNSTVKDWDACDVRWALMYPDAYEVGLPNQGVMILYEVLNEREGVLAERTYSVWPDMEAKLREHGVPQFTVDGHRPVGDFDLFGVSFSTELGYTNLLTALDLAGIPLEAADRDMTHPVVIAMSCCCASRPPAPSTCRASTTSNTWPTAGSSGSRRTARVCRGRSPSTR
jgi:hypothetical protein